MGIYRKMQLWDVWLMYREVASGWLGGQGGRRWSAAAAAPLRFSKTGFCSFWIRHELAVLSLSPLFGEAQTGSMKPIVPQVPLPTQEKLSKPLSQVSMLVGLSIKWASWSWWNGSLGLIGVACLTPCEMWSSENTSAGDFPPCLSGLWWRSTAISHYLWHNHRVWIHREYEGGRNKFLSPLT